MLRRHQPLYRYKSGVRWYLISLWQLQFFLSVSLPIGKLSCKWSQLHHWWDISRTSHMKEPPRRKLVYKQSIFSRNQSMKYDDKCRATNNHHFNEAAVRRWCTNGRTDEHNCPHPNIYKNVKVNCIHDIYIYMCIYTYIYEYINKPFDTYFKKNLPLTRYCALCGV